MTGKKARRGENKRLTPTKQQRIHTQTTHYKVKGDGRPSSPSPVTAQGTGLQTVRGSHFPTKHGAGERATRAPTVIKCKYNELGEYYIPT